MVISTVFAIFASYIIGSIPFGFIAGRIFNLDIRSVGSGNIGATNVLRTLGPKVGVPVFLLDLLKGTAAVYLAISLNLDPLLIILCGITAILGHTYSLFLGFKGGKGVATGVGVLIGINPLAGVLSLSIALMVMAITKYVSLGSLLGTLSAPILLFIFNAPLPYIIFSTVAAVLIFIRHISNIKKLISGTERKIGEKT